MDNLQLFLVVVCSHNEFSLQLKMCAILAVAKLLKLISTSLKLIPPSISFFLKHTQSFVKQNSCEAAVSMIVCSVIFSVLIGENHKQNRISEVWLMALKK